MAGGLGGSHGLYIKDMETKAGIADVESKALSVQRSRDIEGALSNPAVAKKIRNGNIVGILALICVAVLVYLFFFVLM
jgi:hypothetical protein